MRDVRRREWRAEVDAGARAAADDSIMDDRLRLAERLVIIRELEIARDPGEYVRPAVAHDLLPIEPRLEQTVSAR